MARSRAGRTSTVVLSLLVSALILATAFLGTMWRIERARNDVLEKSTEVGISLPATNAVLYPEQGHDPSSVEQAPAVVIALERGEERGTVHVLVGGRTFSCGDGAEDVGWRSVEAAARGARDELVAKGAERPQVAGRVNASHHVDTRHVIRGVDLLVTLGCKDVTFVGTPPPVRVPDYKPH